MKASQIAQQELLALAALDLEIGRAKRAIAAIRSGDQHEAIRAQQREIGARLLEARNALDNAELELARTEADLKLVEAREQKDQKQLKSTSVPSIATGIQHELATLARRRSELEDIELAILEQRDELGKSFAAIGAEKAEVDAQLSQAQGVAEQEAMKLQSGLALQQQDRAQLVARLDAALVEAYDRKSLRGNAAGRLASRECTACHIGLGAVSLAALTALPVDELPECPECGAFLVRS